MTPAPDLLRALAELLAYPGPALAAAAEDCAARLAALRPDAAALEEAYTAAFDLAPVASPYVGDQLFGASRERSLLLAGLAELRRDAGLPAGVELPDHVSEVLRLVAAGIPEDVRDDLLAEALAPALRKMLAALEEARHPWADAVAAAALAVEPRAEASPSRALEAS